MTPSFIMTARTTTSRVRRNAFCINPGNTAETTTLKPLVDKPREKFGISKVVVCTDLEDNAAKIIKMNGGRWIIEDCFRLTKTKCEARPVFLRRDDRIKAHFLAVSGEGYIPTYTRGDLTNNLHGSAGFRTDTQIVSKTKYEIHNRRI